uniref:Uncharacterized protein n=1 Tax=Lactuca sativa TaxID=4236 RepID=A0A9R1WPQ6_LACSA|nr:hypothetical protein LSAT_V11C100018540 [Lactuca sativa]
MKANHESLRAILGDMPLLTTFVASTRLTSSLMTLAALPTSTALLASSPRIKGLGPLGCRLRLSRSPIHPLGLGLLPGLSLQLDLPLPGICLKLSKCTVRRVQHELSNVPPQIAQTGLAQVLGGLGNGPGHQVIGDISMSPYRYISVYGEILAHFLQSDLYHPIQLERSYDGK